MKERPIIFSADSVRAILDGRKTQTRRVMKPQPQTFVQDGRAWQFEDCDGIAGVKFNDRWVDCPYGAPGDRLWVREKFSMNCNSITPLVEQDGGGFLAMAGVRVNYCADESERQIDESHIPDDFGIPDDNSWRPSIHMPRWASRITLEVTRISVERVQDISSHDAEAESVGPVHQGETYRDQFANLWNSLNDKRGFPWQTNPWVWVVEFKHI